MNLYLHDNTPAAPGEKHGPDGPTHCGTVRADYEYQIEMWVTEIEMVHQRVVRLWCPDLGREWKRGEDKKFVEIPAA